MKKKTVGTVLIIAGLLAPFITTQIGIRTGNDLIGVFGGVILLVLLLFIGLDLRRSESKSERTDPPGHSTDAMAGERSSSYLPIAGVWLGGLALVVAIAALYRVTTISKRVPEDLSDQLAALRISSDHTAAAAAKSAKDIVALRDGSQSAFNIVASEIGDMRMKLQKLGRPEKSQ